MALRKSKCKLSSHSRNQSVVACTLHTLLYPSFKSIQSSTTLLLWDLLLPENGVGMGVGGRDVLQQLIDFCV